MDGTYEREVQTNFTAAMVVAWNQLARPTTVGSKQLGHQTKTAGGVHATDDSSGVGWTLVMRSAWFNSSIDSGVPSAVVSDDNLSVCATAHVRITPREMGSAHCKGSICRNVHDSFVNVSPYGDGLLRASKDVHVTTFRQVDMCGNDGVLVDINDQRVFLSSFGPQVPLYRNIDVLPPPRSRQHQVVSHKWMWGHRTRI